MKNKLFFVMVVFAFIMMRADMVMACELKMSNKEASRDMSCAEDKNMNLEHKERESVKNTGDKMMKEEKECLGGNKDKKHNMKLEDNEKGYNKKHDENVDKLPDRCDKDEVIEGKIKDRIPKKGDREELPGKCDKEGLEEKEDEKESESSNDEVSKDKQESDFELAEGNGSTDDEIAKGEDEYSENLDVDSDKNDIEYTDDSETAKPVA